ncbi:hypothetical protein EsH8_II_000195 [Colletotrichum jinshuiense]
MPPDYKLGPSPLLPFDNRLAPYPTTIFISLHPAITAKCATPRRDLSSTFNIPQEANMSSHKRTFSQSQSGTKEKTYFEEQREELIGEIAMSFEHVLANINKLNRSLEAVITVGNEFSSVEALWSQFENVMAKEPEQTKEGEGSGEGETKNEERS